MATFSTTLRSGLPRVSGGQPWPPEGTVGQPVEWEAREWVSAEAGAADPADAADSGDVAEVTGAEAPTADSVESDQTGVDSAVDETAAAETDAGVTADASLATDAQAPAENGAAGAAVGTGAAAGAVADDTADSAPAAQLPLRRGLPRVSGGDAWPPEGFAPAGVKAPAQAGGAAASAAAPTATAAPETGDGESIVEQSSIADGTSAEDALDVAETTETAPAAEATDAAATDAPVAAGAGIAGAGAGAGVGAGVAAASAGDDASGAVGDDASSAAASVPLRRGLPRRSGGDPWPPEGFAPAGAKGTAPSAVPAAGAAAAATAESTAPVTSDQPAADTASARTVSETDTTTAPAASADAAAAAGAGVAAGAAAGGAKAAQAGGAAGLSDVPLRRGLPRTAGGDAWPPEGFAPATATGDQTTTATGAQPAAESAEAPSAAAPAETTAAAEAANAPDAADASETTGGEAPAVAAGAAAADKPAAAEVPAERTGLPKTRTGLPKSTGPDAGRPGDKPTGRTGLPKTGGPATKPAEKPAAKTSASAGSGAKSTPAGSTSTASTTSAETSTKSAGSSTEPKTAASTASATSTADKPAAPAKQKREPIMIGSKSLGQWAKLGSWGLGGLIVAAGIIILAARGVTTLPGVPEFLERYPGEYELPDFVEPGFPAWARWTHFLNFFFIILIIRTGLQVRHQQKPPAYYTPKRGGKKISINLWLHTSLDLLWLANGVVFVVLLFVSGHWARIVPTSWEVFPNALSALLQYMTMEWPMEDAWVNYNALQQLMYFIVVFIAAPLAAITGVRMSEWWPKNATALNKIYPAPLARAIHFPTMIFFVFFIAVHVFLVFTTGLRQNLGYMFAGTNVLGWAGVIWFLVSLAVVIGGWFAARPLLVAPIANLFGRVSAR